MFTLGAGCKLRNVQLAFERQPTFDGVAFWGRDFNMDAFPPVYKGDHSSLLCLVAPETAMSILKERRETEERNRLAKIEKENKAKLNRKKKSWH